MLPASRVHRVFRLMLPTSTIPSSRLFTSTVFHFIMLHILRTSRVLSLAIAWIAAPVLLAQSPQRAIDEQVPQAIAIRDGYLLSEPVPSKRTLHIVYWTPKDREPIDGYQQRLTRVMLDIQAFYRTEMNRLGFGLTSFELPLDSDQQIRIHLVQGNQPYANYNVNSGGAIREECRPHLAQSGIDIDRETIVLFCNMSNWDPQAMTMSQNSPYYATGGLRNGTAWQVDSALLDSARLTDKEPIITDAQYGRISVGKYNSIFVGGVCHELGHALGLPHDKERPDEARAFGTSLMGSGNRTYGDDRRGEGRGSFLTLADGLRLAAHPLFTRNEKGIDLPPFATIQSIEIDMADDQQSFMFRGQVHADPPAYAVIGYLDPTGGSDYDATTTTAIPDAQGNFRLACRPPRQAGSGALRLVVCQSNGGRINDQTKAIPYQLESDGTIDLKNYTSLLQLEEVVAAIRDRQPAAATAALEKLERNLADRSDKPRILDVARSLVRSLNAPQRKPLEPRDEANIWLSDSQPLSAQVGWLRPMFDRVPNESIVMSLGGQLYAHGLYAHAPSNYTYSLKGHWTRLSGHFGVADGHDGSCIFVIRCDGVERWRSESITQGQAYDFNVALNETDRLELIVEDSGDGNGGDWGLWTDVQLHK
jgi:hypothetical protein